MTKTKYLSSVVINIDKQYSRSYGNPINVKYPIAKITGNWIYLIDENGFSDGKMNINGKHFNFYNGREIKETTFKNTEKKLYKKYLAKRDKRNIQKQKEDEAKAKVYSAELKKALRVVKNKKKDISDFYTKNHKGRKGSLGSHQASTWMAFMLAKKLGLKITPLKDALKKVF